MDKLVKCPICSIWEDVTMQGHAHNGQANVRIGLPQGYEPGTVATDSTQPAPDSERVRELKECYEMQKSATAGMKEAAEAFKAERDALRAELEAAKRVVEAARAIKNDWTCNRLALLEALNAYDQATGGMGDLSRLTLRRRYVGRSPPPWPSSASGHVLT